MPANGSPRAIQAGQPLNLGVFGLGRRWHKEYAPALAALSDCFRVSAVCAAVQERADLEARRLGCVAAAGPTELLHSDATDALLLLDAPWYGLWPLELACRLGKPVYCVPGLIADPRHADALLLSVHTSGIVVSMANTWPLLPAALRLRELLDGPLGAPRVVACDWCPAERASHRNGSLLGATGGAVLEWCVSILGGTPSSVWAIETQTRALASVLLELSDGRALHFVQRRGTGKRSSLKVHVTAERGQVRVDLPRRLVWTEATGRHTQLLSRSRSVVRTLLQRFHQAIAENQRPTAAVETAQRSLRWLRAIERSRSEGRRVDLEPQEEMSRR